MAESKDRNYNMKVDALILQIEYMKRRLISKYGKKIQEEWS